MEQPMNTAELLARPSPHASTEEALQVVSFRVGGEEFALDILCVQEIIQRQHLTRVPNSPDWLDGVINLRGRVIPVIALRKRFGLQQKRPEGESRVVVLKIHDLVVGFHVDSVPEVLRTPASAVMSPHLGKVERDYVSGVVVLEDRLLMVLDVERIMSCLAQAQIRMAARV
jgi:purine-binding chemotaxis protein CheW